MKVHAKYLVDILKGENCKLTILGISFNKFTDEGAEYLSDALKSGNCKLATLGIGNNDVTDAGSNDSVYEKL